MTLDDTLWDLLDKLHLSGFFEKYNIPPILLPILIIAVIAIVALVLLMPHGAPVTVACGDGFCNVTAGEDPASCATDCAKTSQNLKAVVVEIANTVSESIDITLRDKAGKTLQKQSGKSQKFTFTGISSEAVSVHAKNPKNGRTAESEEFPVTTDPTTVPFGLPKDFFDTPPVPPSKGTLTLVIKDAATKAPVTATVSIFLRTGEGHALVKSEQIDGIKELSMDSNQWYSIVAEAYGYVTYDGRSNSVNLESGGENTITAELTAVPSDLLAQPAMVRVCVLDQDGNLVNGSVKAETLGGSGIRTQGLVSGCTQFEFTSGSAVTLTTTEMASCITSSQELITSPGENTITLNVTCGEPGQARVRLVDENNTVLTRQASITARYSSGSQITGTGSTGKLAMGEGNYTEFVAISPGVRFYFIIANVPGYSTYTSGTYTVSTLENKSITITLHPPPPVEYNFTFSGISYPNPAGTGSQFMVSVSKVLYGDTDVTSLANVTIGIAGQSCSVARPSVWTATCTAPQVPGVYDLAISATYNSKNGVTVKSLNVLTRVQGYFTLSMRTLTDNEPPIPMQFDITFNGTPLSALSDSDVTVYYVEGGIQVSKLELSGSNGLYSLSVDTPYPGEHRLDIKLVKTIGSVMYEQNFTVYFEVELNSLKVTPTTRISPRILEPGEAYNAIAIIKYNNNEVVGLQNVYITVQGIRTQLLWDSMGHTYTYAFLAPSMEGIYTAQFDLGYQKLSEVDFYVVDTTKSKAEECPISDCQKVPDVRVCVYDYRYESMYSEDDTIDCIKSGWVMDVDLTHCISAVGSKGDWYESCELDSMDVAVLTDVLNRMPDPTERAGYAGCGDMDNDGDVDSDDLTCLTNVVATKWFGDVGDETCTIALMGGFCADMDDALPGDYDGDEAIDSTDSATMRVLVSAASAGVTEPEELLALADFNGDNNIDSGDQACIDTIAGGGTIPTACLAVYNFGCNGLKGDLTQDGNLNEIDLLLEYWIVYGRTEGNECADMDGDGIYTESDYMCLQALIEGDSSAAEEFCINCIFEMQKYGTDPETGEYLRYGLEVCNDGLDNDCDDEIDEDCTCTESVSCEFRKRDEDGVPDTNDFQECAWTNWDIGGTDWHWLPAGADLEMECLTCENVEELRVMQMCERKRWCFPMCEVAYANRNAYWLDLPDPRCETYVNFNAEFGFEGFVCPSDTCTEVKSCDKGPSDNTCPKDYVNVSKVLEIYGHEGDAEYVESEGGDTTSARGCCMKAPCTACASLTPSTQTNCKGSCFPAGTKITMADGSLKSIEDVRVEEKIMGYDADSGVYSSSEVLVIETPVAYKLYTIRFANGVELRLTSEHPLYTLEMGWAAINPEATYGESKMDVSKLELGHKVFNIDYGWLQIKNISVESIPKGIQTYNLKSVSGPHDFFADGFLAHNKGADCPSVYSYDGTGYALEGTIFALSILPSWEHSSYLKLEALAEDHGLLNVRIAQEVSEISNSNAMKLYSVDHPRGTDLLVGPNGKLHTISSLVPPISCTSRGTNDCLEYVSVPDGDTYSYSVTDASIQKVLSEADGPNERIVLEFDVPPGAEDFKIVLKGAYSLSMVYFYWMDLKDPEHYKLLDNVVALSGNSTTHESQTPISLSPLIDDVLKSYLLTAELLVGDSWEYIGSILTDYELIGGKGYQVLYSKLPKGSKKVKVRLSYLLGTISLDYAAADFSKDAIVTSIELPLVTVTGSTSPDSTGLIANDDNAYLTLHPGEYIDAFFKPRPSSGTERSYILWAKGYHTFDIDSPPLGEPFNLSKSFYDETYVLRYITKNYPPNRERFLSLYLPSR